MIIAKLFEETNGTSVKSFDRGSRVRRFLDAQISAIREIVDEHQTTINKRNIGFKGFVPATFARLVNERFTLKVGNEARIKVTAPRELVRNRKALPDPFESEAIEKNFRSPDWPKGQVLMKQLEDDGDVNGGAKLVHPGGAKLVHLTLCGTRCWGVVPVVHRRDPRCFV